MGEDISKLFNNLMDDLEKNITDKAKRTKIKNELIELVALFISSTNNLVRVQDKQEIALNKIKKIEKKLSQIEEDIYIEGTNDEDNFDKMHDNDYEFEIRCPYCDYEFVISEALQRADEIECPKCHNVIELDWDEASNCIGDCDNCNQHCYQDEYEDEENALVEKLSEDNEEYNVNRDAKVTTKNNIRSTSSQNRNKNTKQSNKNANQKDTKQNRNVNNNEENQGIQNNINQNPNTQTENKNKNNDDDM